jgi:anti-anti-sigma factor
MDPAGRPTADDDVLRITHESRGTVSIVHAFGEVDMATAPLLSSGIKTGVADKPTKLVVDLTNVTFMSSPGLTVLADHHRLLEEKLLPMVVVTAQRAVLRPLAITGLTGLLTVVESTDEAIALP